MLRDVERRSEQREREERDNKENEGRMEDLEETVSRWNDQRRNMRKKQVKVDSNVPYHKLK